MKLLELFSVTYPYTIKAETGMYGYGKTATFTDATGSKVEVDIDPIEFEEKSVWGWWFSRNDSDRISGDGKEVTKVFATVIKATDEMLKGEDVDVLVFTADHSNGNHRARLYQKLIDRYATKYGLNKNAPPGKLGEFLTKFFKDDGVEVFYLSRSE